MIFRELPMTEIIRIPTEIDYKAAIDLTDESLSLQGGAWVAAIRPEVLSNRVADKKCYQS